MAFKEHQRTDPSVTDNDLWTARAKVENRLHPDTGETIPLPFRMSSWVPMNMPIITGMLFSQKTTASITFWQILN
jgi:hypothetical protein